MNIERATKQDYNELMDLLVSNVRIHNPLYPRFEEMFPDLYQPTDESMNCHFITRQDGRIAAAVGVYPFKVRIANVRLEVAGVGAVCTTPEYQGKGLISALLQAARADISARGYALSWLTGGHESGWEKVGSDLLIRGADLRPEDAPRGWTLKQVASLDQSMSAIQAARDRMIAGGICDRALFTLKTRRLGIEVWEATQGSAYAYAIINRRENWLAEWGGNVEGVRALIYKLMTRVGHWFVRLPPLHDDFVNMFLRVATVIVPGVDYVSVTNLPALARAYEPYWTSLWPRDQGLHLMVCAEDNLITEVCISGGGKVHDRLGQNDFMLRLDSLRMSILLFGPIKPSMLLELPINQQWLDRVFPLPFYVPYLWRV